MEHHEVTGQRLMAEADSMVNSTQVSMYILVYELEWVKKFVQGL